VKPQLMLVLSMGLLAAFVSFAAETTNDVAVSAQFSKHHAISVEEWGQEKTEGVSVREVSDYVFGNYRGEFPSPPHADLNPKRAYIVRWKDFPFRFVFTHEGSYCPWFEFTDGSGVCYQFLEGNDGWAELFNNWGRQERNSFVEVIESGPQRVWIRWTYFGVNMEKGQPAYHATEDFWAYPNGLILRRQTYESLIPNETKGYAREPIEMIGLCPVGKRWFDVLKVIPETEERHALAVLDPFSDKRYDVFWKPKPGTVMDSTHRQSGCDWKEFENAVGVALVIPLVEGAPFCIYGDASGFDHKYTRNKEHTFPGHGNNWGSSSWDHWPIGWLNSQAHPVDEDSLMLYPNHFSPAGMDFFALANEESARGVYYSLLGVGGNDLEAVREIARKWLNKGESAVGWPDSPADLPHLDLGGVSDDGGRQ
jgi:hypothetical protein